MHRSPIPALSVKRRSEPVATYVDCCDTPATDNGSKCAQSFMGTKTLLTDVYGIKFEKKSQIV